MKVQKHFCEKCMKETNFFEEMKEQSFLFDHVVKVNVNIPELKCSVCLTPHPSPVLTKEEENKVKKAYEDVTGKRFNQEDRSGSIIHYS